MAIQKKAKIELPVDTNQKWFIKCRILIFVSCFLLYSLALDAQKLKKLISEGDKAFTQNDFFSAAEYYNRAILLDSTNISIQYKYAEVSRLNFDYATADHWYAKVYKQDVQGKLYPECGFWLAMVKKNQGNYKEAKKLFDKYAKKNKKIKDSYFVKKATQEITSCDYAQVIIDNPDKSVRLIHLDSMVNSNGSEYAPVQMDSLLYFSSMRDITNRNEKNSINYNKIYTSIQDSLKWENSIELDTLFNREGINTANAVFNLDFNKAFISRCPLINAMEYNCEIYFSENEKGKWTSFKKLPSEINTPGYTNTQPAIGFLGNTEVLFFVSDRPGGEGKMDIWYSKINKDGSYGKVINAGKKVNSIDDEITPFYCNPCQELFFSSNWHKGLGGFDIFKSDYRNNELAAPKNLGLPFNSSYNDIYFSINSKRTQAFISSNRKGSYFEKTENCCNDIYMIELPKMNVSAAKIDSTKIVLTQMKSMLPLSLYFHNDEPDKKTLATTTSKNYKNTYDDYSAMREFYKTEYSKDAKGRDLEKAIRNIDGFFDDSVDAGMKNLEKFAQLLLKVLQNNEKVSITLKGYCSPLASTEYNINLAKRRLSSLKNYFSGYQNGIFLRYIDNNNPKEGGLQFIDKEIGELKANPGVSDDYYDTKNSIYNPAAASERKIQIIAISLSSH